MLRILTALAVVAALAACQAPDGPSAGPVWRAFDDSPAGPRIAYELRQQAGTVTGEACILDADHPRDFAYGKRAPMTVVERSGRALTMRVKWSGDLKATFRFEFPFAGGAWPDTFPATVSEIIDSEAYDARPYTFTRVR